MQIVNYIKIKMKQNKKSQINTQDLKRFLVPEFSKQAQIKIQEMAFMLIAVILFFILVGLFILSIFFVNLQKEATNLAEDKTLSAVTNIANTPELNCEIGKTNCIDGDKLISLINLDGSYENFWGFSSLRIVRLDAIEKDYSEMIKCDFANYPECDLFEVYDKEINNERAVSSFVALCRKDSEDRVTYDRCEVAKIIAGTRLR